MFGFLARVLRVYRGYWGVMGVIFCLLLLFQVLTMMRPLLYGRLIDTLPLVLGAQASPSRLFLFGTLAALTIPVGSLISFIRVRIEIWHFEWDIKRVVERLTLERLMRFSPGQYIRENSGLKLSVVNKGQESLNSLNLLLIYELGLFVIELGTALVAVTILSPKLGLVLLVGLFVYVGCTALLNHWILPKLREKVRREHLHNQFYKEILENIPLIQFFTQEERMVQECEEDTRSWHDYTKGMWSRYIAWTAVIDIVVMGCTAIVLFWFAVQEAISGSLSVGVFTTVVWWAGNGLRQMQRFRPVQRKFMALRVQIERFFSMLDEKPDIIEDENPRVLKKVWGRIEFRDVCFSYRRAKNGDSDKSASDGTLSSVSFSVDPGEMVAIVGPSGAGKSTVVRLLMRAMDVTGGAIYLDGTDIRRLALKQLRGSIGLVDQETVLFDGKLRENIALGLDDGGRSLADDDLRQVAALARVDEFTDRLADGFDTVVGERGIKLSGGQKQRVGIARAIMPEPPILLFDEATSSLDAENEQAIARALDTVAHGRTTIIIAHRFSTIRRAQKVIVMDYGRVVDIGTHEQLEERCEVYQRLLENQRL